MKQNSTTSVCTATSSWGGSGNQYVDSFIADLHKQRYAGDTIRRCLGMVRNFSRWMDQHQVCPAELNDAAIDRYLTILAQSPKPPSGDRRKEIAGALHALLRHLRRQGVIAHPEPSPLTMNQQWVVKYDAYLDRIVGLAPTTRKRYLYFAGRFLSSICTTEFPDWSSITADRIGEFVLQDAAAMHLLQSGVDISMIALWLGHESKDTTHVYLEADLNTKEQALQKLAPVGKEALRFKATDEVLAFLATL